MSHREYIKPYIYCIRNKDLKISSEGVEKMEVFNRHDIEKKIVNKLEFNAITTKTNRYFIRYTWGTYTNANDGIYENG